METSNRRSSWTILFIHWEKSGRSFRKLTIIWLISKRKLFLFYIANVKCKFLTTIIKLFIN
jgi:hypothetical protein